MITNKGYIIKKNKYKEQEINKIKEELTITPINEYSNQEIEAYELWSETENELIIPRYYGINKFGKVKEEFNYKNIELEFKGKLKDEQVNIVNLTYKQMEELGGAVICAGCGDGKTCMALYIASLLKVKTLIIVHKLQLLDQWKERIEQFIKTDSIGIIRQKQYEIDKDIIIGTVQTLCKKNMNEIIKDVGLIIYDEAHHYPAKYFSQTLKYVTKYSLALTATPKRTDKLENILYMHIGNIAYEKKAKINENVIVKMFHYGSSNKLFIEKTSYFKGQQKPNNVKMISNIISIEERNNNIMNILFELSKNKDRYVLVLSDRISHLREIHKKINERITNKEYKIYEYTGKIKRTEQKEAEQMGNMLLSTYKLSEEGLDLPHLNTIVLITPKKNVTQSIGRILRKTSVNVNPLIIDIWDKLSIYRFHGIQRRRIYMNNKYKIENYFVYDNEILTNTDFNKKIGYDDNYIKTEWKDNIEQIINV